MVILRKEDIRKMSLTRKVKAEWCEIEERLTNYGRCKLAKGETKPIAVCSCVN